MKKIVLASSNPGKVREINQLLSELDLQVVPQGDYGVADAEETGDQVDRDRAAGPAQGSGFSAWSASSAESFSGSDLK